MTLATLVTVVYRDFLDSGGFVFHRRWTSVIVVREPTCLREWLLRNPEGVPRMTEEHGAGAPHCGRAESQATPQKVGFVDSRVHAALAYLATRRWPRLFGYSMLIVACRVVRTIIRA